ncbi:hypothetical protein KDX32_28495 [Burkholderia ambifaria]|jgi:hypothetical protein|uniref:Uncharacterized protein n=5 Tax=Burkholderiaceae TaxID=119060 RepID=Q0B1N2_BURCM|nr:MULTISPECIES: hypothetical protein [Burkholderia]ACB68537.1 conserved hypothetical protein [Burkholderia ambifaria MC40-6]MDP9585788.1 hypothetical protein [Burkholderia contaminans]ABI91941.1 hypothetical protein Bamb_6397 [Burkholderia ambifaria AMMD]AJY26368.1 hypothetical protein CH72_5859 [Burkholderia ambifaria AMMD]MBR7932582.1 hypothetical protein [Burkholderia ambifaria]
MVTLNMQAIACGKTIHVVLMADAGSANVFVMDNENGSRQSQSMKVRQYLDAGMTDASVARHVISVVVAAIERRGHRWAH